MQCQGGALLALQLVIALLERHLSRPALQRLDVSAAQNDRPVPVITIALTAGSRPRRGSASRKLSNISTDMALAARGD